MLAGRGNDHEEEVGDPVLTAVRLGWAVEHDGRFGCFFVGNVSPDIAAFAAAGDSFTELFVVRRDSSRFSPELVKGRNDVEVSSLALSIRQDRPSGIC